MDCIDRLHNLEHLDLTLTYPCLGSLDSSDPRSARSEIVLVIGVINHALAVEIEQGILEPSDWNLKQAVLRSGGFLFWATGTSPGDYRWSR